MTADNIDGIPIYQAPPRPRLSAYSRQTLGEALGKRDLTKGERSTCTAYLSQVRDQATREGCPSMPQKAGDAPELMKAKALRIDGIGDLLACAPEIIPEDERELLPRILKEALTGFQPHPLHVRGEPGHVHQARRERTAQELADAKRAKEANAHDDRLTKLEEGQSQILAALQTLTQRKDQ